MAWKPEKGGVDMTSCSNIKLSVPMQACCIMQVQCVVHHEQVQGGCRAFDCSPKLVGLQVVKDHEKGERKAGHKGAKAADKPAAAVGMAATVPAKPQQNSLQHLLKPSHQSR